MRFVLRYAMLVTTLLLILYLFIRAIICESKNKPNLATNYLIKAILFAQFLIVVNTF
jgi:hypothetical protein